MKSHLLFQPWKDLKKLQDKKLNHFINRYLYPFSPYYRKLFDENKIRPGSIKTVEDLRHIPLTSKRDFVGLHGEDETRRNLDFILQPDEKSIKKYLPKITLIRGKDYIEKCLEKEYAPIFLTATAGTTGMPVAFLYTSYDIQNLSLYGKRIVEVFDIKPGTRAVNVFPYAPHLAFWQSVFAGFGSNMFILSTGGGKTIGTEGNIRFIQKIRPQFLIGVASYIYHILKAASEQHMGLSFLKNIALGAARVPAGFKKKIANILIEMGASGVRIMGTYGFTEARCAWAECPTDLNSASGYHTYPDKEVFEVIDPETAEVVGEGEDGELVYTNIDSRATCVLRYRTGDLVKGGIIYSACPYCKRTVPRISSDIVRTSNIKDIKLSKIKGALVNLNIFEHILDDKEEIDEWQIEIVKKNNDPYEVDELILFVSLLQDINREEFSSRLKEEVFIATEVSFNQINFVSSQEIRRRIEIESSVKAKKIVDKREEKMG